MTMSSPPDDEPGALFCRLMMHLSRRWRARLDERLRPAGMTQSRTTLLMHLACDGDGHTQSGLATALGVEAPTLARMLDGLESQGLVARRPSPADRRAKTIHLTEAATPVIAEIADVAARLRDECLAGIPPEDLAACSRVFTRLLDRLAEPADGGSPP